MGDDRRRMGPSGPGPEAAPEPSRAAASWVGASGIGVRPQALLVVATGATETRFLLDTVIAGGYEAVVAHSRTEALRRISSDSSRQIRVVLLAADGLRAAGAISDLVVRVVEVGGPPVIVISRELVESEELEAFRAGAQAYLHGRLTGRRLSGHIATAVTESRTLEPMHEVSFGDLTLDLSTRVATVAGAEVRLTRTEFDVAAELVQAKGRVVRRDGLLARIWGNGEGAHSIDVHVSRMRRKLARADSHVRIVAVHGVGLRLTSDA